MSIKRQLKLLGVAALAILLATVLAACGGDSDDDSDTSAKDADGAFITGMVAHHESAIEMAQMATEQAEKPEIKKLAGQIISAQQKEITELEAAHERLFGGPVGSIDHGDMGMSEEEMGMSADMGALENAKPFDREFIDMMVPHHQGAIRMARIELEEGEDPQLHEIANMIIEAQSAEIEKMNAWREMWYGAPSPAGGVPEEGEGEDSSMEGMEGMDH